MRRRGPFSHRSKADAVGRVHSRRQVGQHVLDLRAGRRKRKPPHDVGECPSATSDSPIARLWALVDRGIACRPTQLGVGRLQQSAVCPPLRLGDPRRRQR